MRATVSTLLIGIAAVAAFGSQAQAADLDAPLYEQAPEIVPVEIGSGWYLRGDVGYAFKSDVDAGHKQYYETFDENGYTHPAFYDYASQSHDGFELDQGATFGLGFGYQFTDYFRGDLTANYWKHDIAGKDGSDTTCFGDVPTGHGYHGSTCRTETDGSVTAWDLMANAYVDVGTFNGITPYVGGGVGAVQVKYEDISTSAYCLNEGTECGEAFKSNHSGTEEWRFAYALMLGASYDLTQSLKIDLGYRYLNVEGGDMYGYSTADKALGASGNQGTDDGFDRHTIQAGIRYSLF